MPKYSLFGFFRKDERNIKAVVQKANLGDPNAQVQLGHHYEDKANGYNKGAKNKDGQKAQSELEKNQTEATKYYRYAYDEYEKAGQQGHPQALYDQGRCLLIGRGVKRDPNGGVECMKSSASLGYEQAMFYLADIYQRGAHGIDKNLQRAREAIIGIATRGNEAAQLKIGQIHEENGNLKEAQAWYEGVLKSKILALKGQALNCLERLAPKVIPIQPGGLPRSPSLITIEELKDVFIDYSEIKFDVSEAGKKVPLGKGGYGNVYLATYCHSKVAVKTLNAMTRDDPDQLNAFTREMSIMRKLRHDNIVSLLGVTERGNKLFMVMQYMCKGSLYDILHKGSLLSWEQRYKFAKDIATGLAFLHSHNSHKSAIIHRDLKSHNVLLDEKMAAKLTDFGLSRCKASTMTQRPMGTAGWIAPELFSNDPIYSEKSDIFALGMVFWEIVARKDPFEECEHPNQIVNKVLGGERPQIPEDCPPAFKELIEWCWDQDPTRRPTADEIVKYLNEHMLEIVNYVRGVSNPELIAEKIANQDVIINNGSGVVPNPESVYSSWNFEM
ncbi:MAG: hypothetical protein AMJ43_00700 [Coxiella sp. DG_40]|nr:MAG: hypothetical protein AMJ43_00700 [Coxiella sp. DG_40]